jgi:hypothetical protein
VTRELFFPLFDWLGHTAVGTTIRSSAALIALAQIVHLLGLTMLAGTILMVDMSLLGLGIRRHPVERIARELTPWTMGGLAVMLISGPLILSSETRKCYDSSFFWVKMGVLAVAVLFYFTAHRRVVQAEPPAPRWRAALVACISLGLWLGVALTGKMVGIYGDDLRRVDSPLVGAAADRPGRLPIGRRLPICPTAPRRSVSSNQSNHAVKDLIDVHAHGIRLLAVDSQNQIRLAGAPKFRRNRDIDLVQSDFISLGTCIEDRHRHSRNRHAHVGERRPVAHTGPEEA